MIGGISGGRCERAETGRGQAGHGRLKVEPASLRRGVEGVKPHGGRAPLRGWESMAKKNGLVIFVGG